MAANGTGTLVFNDHVTTDQDEVYRAILCSHLAKFYKIDRTGFTVEMVNDPKHTAKAENPKKFGMQTNWYSSLA